MVNRGEVEWWGENPGMHLVECDGGATTALISHFAVSASPHGPGDVIAFIANPTDPGGRNTDVNAIYTNNPILSRYIVTGFLRHFEQYRRVPGLTDLPVRKLGRLHRKGALNTTYQETARTEDGELHLIWSEFGRPFFAHFPAASSPTRKHDVFSLLVPSGFATARLGTTIVTGKPSPRRIAGTAFSSAFLAFCETWVRHEPNKSGTRRER